MRNNKMVNTMLWLVEVWLVVGDSNTCVSVERRARLPGPGHQNISNAARRETSCEDDREGRRRRGRGPKGHTGRDGGLREEHEEI